MSNLLKKIQIQNQKIMLYQNRIAKEAKELERLQGLYVQSEKTKLLRKWYPKIKDDFYKYSEDLINAILTIAGLENHTIEIRNINYEVKFYYLDSKTGKMKCIQ